MGLVVISPGSVEVGEVLEDRGGPAEDRALLGRELAEALVQPGGPAVAVGQQAAEAGLGELDDDLAAVGLVRPADDVAV